MAPNTPGRDAPRPTGSQTNSRRDADAAREASAPGRAASDHSIGHTGETGANPNDETRVGDIHLGEEDPGRSTNHPSRTGTEWGMKSRGEESTPSRRPGSADEDAAAMRDTNQFGMGEGDSGTNPEA